MPRKYKVAILLTSTAFICTPSVPEWLVDCWCAVYNEVVDDPYSYNGNLDHPAEDCAIRIHQSFWNGGSIKQWQNNYKMYTGLTFIQSRNEDVCIMYTYRCSEISGSLLLRATVHLYAEHRNGIIYNHHTRSVIYLTRVHCMFRLRGRSEMDWFNCCWRFAQTCHNWKQSHCAGFNYDVRS